MRKKLAPQELEIMKVIWELKTASVREVYEWLREERKIAYTTVMTMMNILEEKRFLKKWRQGRAYVYEPTRPKEEIIKGMVHDFVNRVFNGSVEPLLLHLVEDRRLTEKELKKLARLIEEAK